MDIELVRDFVHIARNHSLNCFINHNFELIVEPRNNIYFMLEDIKTELDVKCKILAWLSRPSCKGVSKGLQQRIRAVMNEYLGTNFTHDEMTEIYTYLGNDCNREKTIKFIESNYNLKVLTT